MRHIGRASSIPLATLLLAVVSLAPATAQSPPLNDDRSAAQQLSAASSGAVVGDTSVATGDQGTDPDLYPLNTDDGGHSLWYRWTAPSTGIVTFDTELSHAGRDTILVAFASGSAVAWNDDVDYVGGNLRSRMGLAATAGTTYLILVDAWTVASGSAAQVGPFTLRWAPGGSVSPPPSAPTPPTPTNVGVTGTAAKAPGTVVSFTFEAKATVAFAADQLEVTLVPDQGLQVLTVVGPAGSHCAPGSAGSTVCWFAGAQSGVPTWLRMSARPLSDEPARVTALLTAPGDADATDDRVTVTAPRSVVCDRVGTARSEVIRGTAAPDVLCGLAGNDVIIGGGGDDLILGGLGSDAASYATATGTAVDLRMQGAQRTAAAPLRGAGHGHDSLVSIENVIGSPGADVIHGDAGPNTLRGGGGADRVYGQGGNDNVLGDAGPDLLIGGAGRDRIEGGLGVDTCRDNLDRRVGCERR